MTKTIVVTTMNQRVYDAHGWRLTNHFHHFFPDDVEFYIYTEEPEFNPPTTRAKLINAYEINPAHLTFVKESKARGIKGQVRKFCHKVYCQSYCYQNLAFDHMHWLDADVYPLAPLSNELLENAIGDSFGAYVAQDYGTHAETGYLGFAKMKRGVQFFKEYQDIYDSFRITKMNPPYDTLAYWATMTKFRDKGKLTFHDLGEQTKHSHCFSRSYWKNHLAHPKGSTKKSNGNHHDQKIREAMINAKHLRISV